MSSSPFGQITDGSVQTNYINMYDYDENGQIVKSYAYIMDNGELKYQENAVEFNPFE